MAYVPFGSLGGLGGAPQIPAPEPNQFQQFVGAPGFGNALQALGMSLMSSPSNNPLQGFAPALQMTQAQTMQEQEAAEREEARQAAEDEKKQWAQYAQSVVPEQLKGLAATDPKGALAIMQQMQPAAPDYTADQQNFLFAQQQGYEGSFVDWVNGGGAGGAGGATEYGLTPIWGQLPDGSFGYGVQGKDGSFKPVDTGDLNPLDPRTLAGERAYGTAVGGAQGGAAAAAPGDIASAGMALDLVQQIKTHPELPWATGTSVGFGGNAIPGTGRFGFQNLVEQAKSGAFLTAIQEMRGLGALSNTEGQAATQAITRMNTALSEQDFLAAVSDYERIVQRGMENARNRIGAGPNVGSGLPAPIPAGASPGWQVIGVTE